MSFIIWENVCLHRGYPMTRIFVKVGESANVAGDWMPAKIYWEDGRQFEIDKIIDIVQVTSLGNGCTGKRYTCIIKGRSKYLYQEEAKWFVEGK
jgi:hypothetical protein